MYSAQVDILPGVLLRGQSGSEVRIFGFYNNKKKKRRKVENQCPPLDLSLASHPFIKKSHSNKKPLLNVDQPVKFRFFCGQNIFFLQARHIFFLEVVMAQRFCLRKYPKSAQSWISASSTF